MPLLQVIITSKASIKTSYPDSWQTAILLMIAYWSWVNLWRNEWLNKISQRTIPSTFTQFFVMLMAQVGISHFSHRTYMRRAWANLEESVHWFALQNSLLFRNYWIQIKCYMRQMYENCWTLCSCMINNVFNCDNHLRSYIHSNSGFNWVQLKSSYKNSWTPFPKILK